MLARRSRAKDQVPEVTQVTQMLFKCPPGHPKYKQLGPSRTITFAAIRLHEGSDQLNMVDGALKRTLLSLPDLVL